MLPNYDLIDNFLPFGSVKATAGQNILSGVFSADRRNFNAYNARQMFLAENVLVKNYIQLLLCLRSFIYKIFLISINRKWP